MQERLRWEHPWLEEAFISHLSWQKCAVKVGGQLHALWAQCHAIFLANTINGPDHCRLIPLNWKALKYNVTPHVKRIAWLTRNLSDKSNGRIMPVKFIYPWLTWNWGTSLIQSKWCRYDCEYMTQIYCCKDVQIISECLWSTAKHNKVKVIPMSCRNTCTCTMIFKPGK